jgi:hypothetical protein
MVDFVVSGIESVGSHTREFVNHSLVCRSVSFVHFGNDMMSK